MQLVSVIVLVFAMATPSALPVSTQENMTPCERFGTAPAVFVGQIGEPTRHWMKMAADVQPIEITALSITVERSFRGVAADAIVYLYPLDVAMAAAPVAGRRYLVFGAFNFGELKDVVMPLLMKPVEEGAEELAFLEAANSPSGTGSISGVLGRGNPFNDSQKRKPLPGVTIRFRSGDTTVEAVTDDDGRYSVFDLPEGFVRIDLSLRNHVVRNGSAEIRAGGCTPHDLLVELNGRIRGRVLRPDASPLTSPVSLLPVNPDRDDFEKRGRSVIADKNGEYEFSALPPGEYLVGVNLNRPPDRGAPFPATYYPGTVRRQDAVPVVVGQGTVHEGIDFTLFDSIRPGKLEIRIEGAVGAASTVVCFQDIDSSILPATPGRGGMYPQFEPGAPILIDLLEGSRYRFVAHLERANGHTESDIIELTGAPGHQTLTVSANRRALYHQPGFQFQCDPFLNSRP